MIEFSKILYLTDFSEPSESAAPYAISIAGKYGCRIYVAHVIEPFTYADDFGIDYGAQLREMEATARRLLDKTVASMKKTGANIESVMLSGNPSAEIVRFARDEAIDLIVMATHGRSGVEHLLMGSVAEKVVRRSPCPVMTVKKK
ncbi:MAG: universal stress protein [Nitrospirae bacterium]|nr:universal stress protein [Nitrospirota bacterium]